MIKFIDIILGIILVAYYFIINLISSRKIAASGSILAIGIILIIYHFVKNIFNDNQYYIKGMKIAKIFICVGLVFFIVLEGMIIFYPKKDTSNTDYIVVLGAGLNNGGQLSLTLKDRLDSALKCVNDYGNNGYIVVSGGQGPDEDLSEAEAMTRYLVEQGVSEEKIIKEDKSRNTNQNFKFSKDKIEEHSGKNIEDVSVKVVTTDFHALRSNLLAEKNGYKNINVYTNNSVPYLIPIFYSREALAIVKSFLFDN
ncbi:YdcF family protein [Clostridium sp. SHJSY1]|uniref:YdcF family protein n=1 Tax=Clostridium sp. SHJSY1 TaxID=2942483 RepID=UPI002876B590|nr:YdcF family protein [Clostridium sp. SHJSY1]MDS0528511.1 YdcF family protein [Clostridium sp. SHJSY1]